MKAGAHKTPHLRDKHAYLIANRKGICSGYVNIPLKIMANYAVDEAKLKISPKLLRRVNKIIKLSNLLGLEKTLMAYVNAKASIQALKTG